MHIKKVGSYIVVVALILAVFIGLDAALYSNKDITRLAPPSVGGASQIIFDLPVKTTTITRDTPIENTWSLESEEVVVPSSFGDYKVRIYFQNRQDYERLVLNKQQGLTINSNDITKAIKRNADNSVSELSGSLKNVIENYKITLCGDEVVRAFITIQDGSNIGLSFLIRDESTRGSGDRGSCPYFRGWDNCDDHKPCTFTDINGETVAGSCKEYGPGYWFLPDFCYCDSYRR